MLIIIVNLLVFLYIAKRSTKRACRKIGIPRWPNIDSRHPRIDEETKELIIDYKSEI